MKYAIGLVFLLIAACGPATPAPGESTSDAGDVSGVDAGGTDSADAGDTNNLDAGSPALTITFTDPPLIPADVTRGDSGLAVGQLQFELKLATGAYLDEDGRFGPATQALLQKFEVNAGLPPTDVADATTRAKLHEAAVAAAHALVRDDDAAPPDVTTPAENLAEIQVISGQGDKTGTYNGRQGFSWGDGAEGESIRQGSPAHLDWVASDATSASERHVIGVISRNEGPFDAVNSYDAGDYTWGAYQLIGSYRADPYNPADDELAQGLAAIQKIDPSAFFWAFRRFGLHVTATWNGDVMQRSSVHVTLALPDGTVLAGKSVWERVGSDPLYNQMFIDAGADPRIQRGEILAAKAVHFDALDVPLATGRPAMRAYLTSERAVCAFLDQELNRGRSSTIRIYDAAVNTVASQRGIDADHPENWPETDRAAIEHDVLQEVLANAPSTAYATRLQRVLSSVFLDDAAHSYVPRE